MIVKITEDVIYNIEKTQAFGKDVIGSRKIKIIKKHTVMKSMTTKCKCGKKAFVIETEDGTYISINQLWISNWSFIFCGIIIGILLMSLNL